MRMEKMNVIVRSFLSLMCLGIWNCIFIGSSRPLGSAQDYDCELAEVFVVDTSGSMGGQRLRLGETSAKGDRR